MKKITVIVLALLLMTTFALYGCSKDEQSTKQPIKEEETQETNTETNTEIKDESGDHSGGTLIGGEHVLDTQMANLNPFSISGTWGDFFDFVYEELLFFNEINGQLEPSLATGYEWSDDFLTLTLPIQPDVTWSDGKPFTAEDASYTFNVLKEYPQLDQYGIWANLESVVADGDNVVFKLLHESTSLPNYISTVQVVPKHIWENEDPSQFFNQEAIGTGPFIFTKYNTGTDIQFDANINYWRGAPKVDHLIIQMFNSSANLTLALLKGEIQFTCGTIAMPSVPELLAQDGAYIQTYTGLKNYTIQMNQDNPLLADVAVRKAMAMAIKQKDLIEKGEYNAVTPTNIGWLPALFGDFVNKEVADSLVFDIKGAQAVLEEAGYTKGKDGIYQKDGARLSFTYHNASGAPAQQMEAGMIQQWLLNLGIEVIPKLATWPELTSRAQTGDYDLIQLGIGFPPDPYAALYASFSSNMTAPSGEATPGTNYTRFRSEKVDKLLADAKLITDEAERQAAYKEIQKEIGASYCFLPMYNVGGHIPYYDGKGVSGWNLDYPIIRPQSMIEVYLTK